MERDQQLSVKDLAEAGARRQKVMGILREVCAEYGYEMPDGTLALDDQQIEEFLWLVGRGPRPEWVGSEIRPSVEDLCVRLRLKFGPNRPEWNDVFQWAVKERLTISVSDLYNADQKAWAYDWSEFRAVVLPADPGAPRLTKRQRGTAIADVLEILADNHTAGNPSARDLALSIVRWLDGSKDEAWYHLDEHADAAMSRMGLEWSEAAGWAPRIWRSTAETLRRESEDVRDGLDRFHQRGGREIEVGIVEPRLSDYFGACAPLQFIVTRVYTDGRRERIETPDWRAEVSRG